MEAVVRQQPPRVLGPDELQSFAQAPNSRLLSADPSVPIASSVGRNPSYDVPNNRAGAISAARAFMGLAITPLLLL